jgi:predicted metal-binding membrane protein
MAALFALGVMSLGWMALIAGLIAAEKLWPSRVVANYGVAAVLLFLAVALAVDPSVVPGTPEVGAGMAGDSMKMEMP